MRLRLPFDGYQLSVDEMYYAEGAADLLIKQCMRKRGFDWHSVKRPRFGTGAIDVVTVLSSSP
jgi:hypothetical protein